MTQSGIPRRGVLRPGAPRIIGLSVDGSLRQNRSTLHISLQDLMKHLLTTSLLIGLAPAALAQNNECATAAAVTAGMTAFDTTAASTSAEVWPCGFGVSNDLWYSYAAANNDTVTISTCGTTFDTLIEAFDGSNCAALVSAVCNDDACGLQSTVSFPAVSGTTYLFRIGGYNGASGAGTFDITLTPPLTNDECLNALALINGTTPFATIGASTSAPAWPCAAGGTDIWYAFTASGLQVDIDTFGSGYDTALELFQGDCGNLVSVGCNDDTGGLQSQLIITTTPGQTYRLRVGGFAGNEGTGVLNVSGAGPNIPGTNYCMGNPNSSGMAASMGATGSGVVASNDLTLVASDLPQNSFGFFITSTTQGFVPLPGGSQGNLCLGGAIGRYVAPGQISNSGTLGEISLLIDNTQTPTPTGIVSIASGQTWNFQCWHRDAVGGSATSNFTDGLSVLFL